MIVIVDSDGLIGLSHKDDVHFDRCHKLLKTLERKHAHLIYPATVIAETISVLQLRLNNQKTADQILEFVKSGAFDIEDVNLDTLVTAASFLGKDRNKHATLFDAIVAAVAQKYKADAIFSFDHFYKNKGFKLASEI